MRTSAIFSSSLLAIAISAAPVDLPKLPVVDGVLNDVKVPVVGNVVRRAELPVVGDALTGLNVDGLVNDVPVVGGIVRRAELPVVGDALTGLNVDGITKGLPVVGDVKLPVKRAELPVVGDALTGLNVDGVTKGLPVVGDVKLPVRRDVNVNVPVAVSVDDLELPNVDVKVARDIKQSLPVVGGADVPLDAGKIQVGTVDNYVDQLVKGTKVDSLPKVARDIDQSLPVVGDVKVPLDAGKIQVGTIDQQVGAVVDGTTLKDTPVLQVVKGTTVKDLPNLGSRDIKQTLPVVGGVDVPLDAGEVQVGTVDKDVVNAVEGIKIGA